MLHPQGRMAGRLQIDDAKCSLPDYVDTTAKTPSGTTWEEQLNEACQGCGSGMRMARLARKALSWAHLCAAASALAQASQLALMSERQLQPGNLII